MMRMNPVTNKTLYELHGTFIVEGVDTARWVEGESKFTGMLGLYYDRDLVDWLTVEMLYNTDPAQITWNCDDGSSSIDSIDSIEQDQRINCFLDPAKSEVIFYTDKAKIKGHFIKPFRTDDTDDLDIKLRPSSHVGAQVRAYFPGEKRATYTTIVLPNLDPYNTSAIWIKTQLVLAVALLVSTFA